MHPRVCQRVRFIDHEQEYVNVSQEYPNQVSLCSTMQRGHLWLIIAAHSLLQLASGKREQGITATRPTIYVTEYCAGGSGSDPASVVAAPNARSIEHPS